MPASNKKTDETGVEHRFGGEEPGTRSTSVLIVGTSITHPRVQFQLASAVTIKDWSLFMEGYQGPYRLTKLSYKKSI
ncbi:unnamed protein product [Lactuca virosa]|uniref:Uncharacterized protein n=1 Tax=Lactuca virosa TaxID=75947 RepID=A0AAU9NS89_9ASTR|nr:unnamed protein product [Lactuca virosa]